MVKARRATPLPHSLLPNPIQLPPPPIQPPPPLPHLISILIVTLLQLFTNSPQTLHNPKHKRFVFQAQRAAVRVEKSIHSDRGGILQRRAGRYERAEQRLRAAGLACAVVG